MRALTTLSIPTITILTLCVNIDVSAQKFDFYGSVGYATYNNADLKAYLRRVDIGVPTKVLKDFPSSVTYHGGFNSTFKRFTIGVEIAHGSTSGRIHYEDSSIIMGHDVVMKYNSFGMTSSVFIYRHGNLSIAAGSKFSFVPTKVETASRDVTFAMAIDIKDHHEYKYDPNLAIQPYISARRSFGKIFLMVNAGYEFQNHAALSPPWDDDFLGPKPEHANGSGLRTSLSAGCLLN